MPDRVRLVLVLTLAAFLFPTDAGAQVPGVSREQMWPAPTAEDWKKPCLLQWQRTWDDAVAVSERTGRPILVCVNMDGEIASEHYAGIRYRDPEIAKLYEPYVCVIASVYRHTPRDHDEHGHRIECPRFGGVTCGEHIWIEPILFDKFMEGERVAPRHIMVELDGKETYDVYYAFDTDSVFDTIRRGIAERDPTDTPQVKGDRTVFDKVASRDADDRAAVEAAFRDGDADMRRALLEAAFANPDAEQLDLLRLALYGVDSEQAEAARRALALSDSTDAVDLINEALRGQMGDGERKKLIGALERLGEKSPKARTLVSVHRGLRTRSRAVDVSKWNDALAKDAPAAGAARSYAAAARLARENEVYGTEDAGAHVALAEAYLQRATEKLEDGLTARREIDALLIQARDTAEKALELGAEGWSVNAVLAIATYHLGDRVKAQAYAAAAAAEMPADPTDVTAMLVLGLFAEERRFRISEAVRKNEDWPGEWLTDLHSTYLVLADHPHGEASQVMMHYDFLDWLGAREKAAEALDNGLRRFPESWDLHERMRRRVFRERGISGIAETYDRMIAAKDASPNIRWFAAFAAMKAAEFHRRFGAHDEAVAEYERAVALFEKNIELNPESKENSEFYIAMILGGRARIEYERRNDEAALGHVLAALDRMERAGATLDGLNISTVDTAKQLLGRFKTEEKSALAETLGKKLASIDPKLLELPAYEGAGPRGGGRQGRGPGRRGARPQRNGQ